MYTLLHTLGCTMIVTTFLGILILEADDAITTEYRADDNRHDFEPIH